MSVAANIISDLKTRAARYKRFAARFMNDAEACERAIRQVRSGATKGKRWKNVNDLELKAGRLYIIRRRIGKKVEEPVLAEWHNGGWKIIDGDLKQTTQFGATIDVWS